MNDSALLEIGVEEIPHEILTSTIEFLKQLTVDRLSAAGVQAGKISVYGTPRRLAIRLQEMIGKTPEKSVEKKGPSWQAAFGPDGNPTKALQGFLNANGISRNDIVNKNNYVYFTATEGGQKTRDILPDIFRDLIASLVFPKTMRWGSGKMTFVRPIRWLTSLYGDSPLEMEIEGIRSSFVSYGHRLLHREAIEIRNAEEYKTVLQEKFVIVDQDERKDSILDQIAQIEKRLNAKAIVSDALLDALVNLTEYPDATVGSFEEEFLSLPKEVLISEMVEHQKYVPLENEGGKLLNQFVIIANTRPNNTIVQGNERVIRSRFSDGKFFFDEDRKRKLADYVPELKAVLFARELGSVYDKTERIRKISGSIAKMIGMTASAPNADRAALLCKADLVTKMVREFTELQGVIGSYYAAHSGELPAVSTAVREHYLPRFSGDALPSADEGILVSLADRFDNLFAMYARGNFVTGSKDPYALRRQTLGIIRILIDKNIRLNIGELFNEILPLYKPFIDAKVHADDGQYRAKILEFVTSRIKTVLKEYGFSYDEIDAVITYKVTDIYDSYLRMTAVHEARKTSLFNDLAVAFKRIKNIIRGKKAADIDQALLQLPAEKELFRVYGENQDRFTKAVRGRDYQACVSILTSFKPAVDRFFNDVLVMDKDMKLQNNRISLLIRIDELFMEYIDFEKIVIE